MPTRSHSASTSLRMCEERKTVWPRSLASRTVSRKATSISGSRPLVGSSRISRSARVANAATSCTFWRLPFESARTFLCVSSWKRSTSTSRYATSVEPCRRGEEVERLRAGQRRPQERLAGDVGDAPVRGHRVAPRVDRRTARRGRRWAGAGRAAAGSSSSCPPRWARGSRRPRPPRPRGRARRARASRRSAWSGPRCGLRLPSFAAYNRFTNS